MTFRMPSPSPNAISATRAATFALALLVVAPAAPALARQQQPAKPAEKPAETAKPAAQQAPASTAPAAGQTQSEIDAVVIERLAKLKGKKPSEWTGEEFAELVALSYGGRRQLSTVYNSGREDGRITLMTATGEVQGDYSRRYVNGATTSKDRVRMDLILETAPRPEDQLRYTIAYNGATVWTAQDNQYAQPEAGSSAAFRASVLNDYTSLFRYKEEGATIARGGTKKMLGLDTELLELTRPDGSKTRFYVSAKTYRILHAEYDVVLVAGQAPVTFRESYTDWRTIQQTLVPGVRKLRQNNAVVQTITINSATYGVTHEDSIFLQL